MVQYIDKYNAASEIERLKDSVPNYPTYGEREAYKDAIFNAMDKLYSIKTNEVDLDDDRKESLAQDYIDYTFKRHNIDPDSKEGQLIYYAYIHGINACLKELRTQKEE